MNARAIGVMWVCTWGAGCGAGGNPYGTREDPAVRAEDHACIHAPQDGTAPRGCEDAVIAPPGTGGHFGEPFAVARTVPLSTAVQPAAPHPGPVRVRGEVEAVCQKRGCWMVLRDGEVTARVLMKDHAFSVPIDARGKSAVAEGTLAVRTFEVGQAKHLAEDADEDPANVVGPRTEFVLTASAVEISG